MKEYTDLIQRGSETMRVACQDVHKWVARGWEVAPREIDSAELEQIDALKDRLRRLLKTPRVMGHEPGTDRPIYESSDPLSWIVDVELTKEIDAARNLAELHEIARKWRLSR